VPVYYLRPPVALCVDGARVLVPPGGRSPTPRLPSSRCTLDFVGETTRPFSPLMLFPFVVRGRRIVWAAPCPLVVLFPSDAAGLLILFF